MSITIVGSLNYDLVTYTNKVPQGGETYQANSFENHLGGKGLNEAIAAARLAGTNGPHIQMVGNIGDDSFGKELKNSLVEANVDTKYIKTIPGISSGVAVIIVEEESGENRILITSGANGELKPSDEDYKTYFIENTGEKDFAMIQNEYPDLSKTIEWLKTNRNKVNIAYNPSPYNPEVMKKVLSQIDLLIVNEGEALDVAKSFFSNVDDMKTVIDQDLVQGCKNLGGKLVKAINQSNVNVVIITMGSKGSIFVTKDQEPQFQPAFKVEQVVDTTGAGDTFFGAVVVKMAGGESVESAVKFATAASSKVIQGKGAVESIPWLKDVSDVY